jgi:ZIP family zinc transporter
MSMVCRWTRSVVGDDEKEHAMPEGITGVVWAFCWGLAAASGLLGGTILALIAQFPHRAIAAIMSFGAGVLLSAAS